MDLISYIKIWYVDLYSIEWIVLLFFAIAVFSYRIFLLGMYRYNRDKLFLKQLQEYRIAWVKKYTMGKEPLVVIQSLRNNIMITSFMASTAILLVIGCFNLLFSNYVEESTASTFLIFLNQKPFFRDIKILMLIFTLSYSFFHFLWHIREMHHMSLIINIPEESFKNFTKKTPHEFVSNIFLRSGFHFSLGIRGYYFMIPLFFGLIHPLFMIFTFTMILFFLIKRDMKRYKRTQKNTE